MKDQINTIREALEQAKQNTTHGQIAWNCKEALAALTRLEAMVGEQEPIGTATSYRDGDGQTRWSFVPKDLAWTVKQNQKAIERGVTRCFDVFAAPPAQQQTGENNGN